MELKVWKCGPDDRTASYPHQVLTSPRRYDFEGRPGCERDPLPVLRFVATKRSVMMNSKPICKWWGGQPHRAACPTVDIGR